TNRSQINGSKLVDDDVVISVTPMTASDVLAGELKIIILTKNGTSLGFPLSMVPELKKTGRGVKAISMDKDDNICFATALDPKAETFICNDKELNARKVRMRKRADKGQKAQL
ncbi:MAG: hypothetical protein GX915_08310, partial [Clostridiales bacterium]|nr:hypothetical protein [Clostridiales bacterium]